MAAPEPPPPSKSPSSPKPPPTDGSGGSSLDLRRIGHYSVVGFVFPLSILVGFFLGRAVGTWLGAPTVGIAVGVVLGSVSAFYNLFTTLGRLDGVERSPGDPSEGSDDPEAAGKR